MIKQALKTILPRPIIRELMDVRDRVRLVGAPQKPFSVDNLRPMTASELQNIWRDPEILSAWEKDVAEVSGLYGHDDTFGGVNPGDRRALYYLIMSLNPASVLEVGTHIGASSLYIAAALKRLNTEGQLTTVDISDVNHPEHGPWRKVGMSRSPSAFAETLGLSDYIDFRVQPCQEYMRQTDKKFDLIFLDGDHSVCAVYNEISVALPLLRENGVILLHDYYKDGKAMYPDGERIGGPFYAVQRIVRENPRINILPLGALPWPTKQGTSVTSLAVVAKS